MENPVINEEILGAEHFDSIRQYIEYRLNMKRNMLGLTNKKNSKDFIVPKINFKQVSNNNDDVDNKLSNLRISPDLPDTKKNYRIVPYKIKTKLPADLYKEFPSIIAATDMHIPFIVVEPEKAANINVPVNKDDLAFISDKTHSESKKILQGLQELYANVKELRNDPHQMLTIPEAVEKASDLHTYFNLMNVRKPVDCSTMGKVISPALKINKKSIIVDMKYYDPYGKIKMFDFNTPCPY